VPPFSEDKDQMSGKLDLQIRKYKNIKTGHLERKEKSNVTPASFHILRSL
jgi:hypothetical protein